MANLVDSLILSLKLDASGFQKGQKDAETSLKKTRETAVGHGKGIEASMRGASDGVNKLTLRFLELYAVLTGGKEIKQFISDTTRSDAAIGRFAANMNMSAKDLQAWQGAVKATGGSAEDASSSIQSFSNQIQAIKAGHPDSNFLLALAQIGGKPINFQAPLNQQIETLADNLRALYKRDPQFATYIAQQVGMSQNMFNTMVKEKGALEALLAAEQKYAATAGDIDAAGKRQTAFQLLIAASERLGRSILTQLTPTILRLSASIEEFLNKHGNELTAWFEEIARRIEAFPWADWFGEVEKFVKRIDEIVTSTVGWKIILEALVGIKILDWLIPVGVQFGLIAAALASIVGLGPSLTAMFGTGGILAAGGALLAALYPQGLNAGEDELARQRRYGQGQVGEPAELPPATPHGAVIPPGENEEELQKKYGSDWWKHWGKEEEGAARGATPASPAAPGTTPSTPGAPSSTGAAGVPGGATTGVAYQTGNAGRGGQWMNFLMNDPDLHLTREQAAGVTGNLSHESGGFTQYHEAGKPWYLGGVGDAQWTGSRRRDFEAWSRSHAEYGPPQGFLAQSMFLKHELLAGQGIRGPSLAAIRRSRSVNEAVAAWERHFEGAGVVAMGSRLRRANAINSSYQEPAARVAPAAPVAPPRYQDFLPPNIGAATAANVVTNNQSSTVHNNNASHEVHVGAVNVHTAATDASGIARDIKPAIERTNFAFIGNYSLA